MSFIDSISKRPEKVFSLFFWRFFFAYLPIGVLLAILALIEIRPTIFNEEPILGIKAFFVELLFILLMPLLITTIVWLFFMIGDFIIKIIVNLIRK